MFIPPTPHNPDQRLMHERNQREDRDARSGPPGKGLHGLSTGDKLISLVLGVVQP
jgi:hypothetical protein